MAAYLFCDVEVLNRDALMEYLDLAKGTVEHFGGRYLAQAGGITVIEGEWNPKTIVIVEFPSVEVAKQWYSSDEYATALKANPTAMHRQMIVVDGLPLEKSS